MTTITIATVATSTIAQLTAFYNANSGKAPIKKFSDRKSAERRVMEILEVEAPTLPESIKNDRTKDVFKFLLQGKVTVKELTAHFEVAYKCITGDLYDLRKAGVKIEKYRTMHGDYAFSIAA